MSEVPRATLPSFFGGARFGEGGVLDPAWDAFGGWRFILPRVLLAVSSYGIEASVTLLLHPGESEAEIAERLAQPLTPRARHSCESTSFGCTTPEAQYCGAVDAALSEIRGDQYDKVVLARTVAVHRPGGIDEGRVLARLAARYDGCYIWKMAAGDAAYIPAQVAGEIRNEGQERAERLAFLVLPPDAMTGKSTPAP